jgi:hypothetical protein
VSFLRAVADVIHRRVARYGPYTYYTWQLTEERPWP